MWLRPPRTIGLIFVALLLWGGIGAAIETFMDGYGRNAGPVLTPSLFLQIISELVYWRYLAIFALLCAIVADHFHRRKISLEDFWGEKGLMAPSSTGPSRSHVWLGLALAVFAAAMGIAERTQSHYFLQDDNYSQFYPGIHYAMENIWSGHWVSWNPLQLLGSPLTDLGIYSLTYPITHICYLVAKHLLGDDTRLMDLFCWFHLALSLMTAYCFGRKLQLSGPLSAAAALCYSLSGFALIGSRSWYYMSPALAAMPLLAALALSYSQAGTPKAGWTLAVGLTLGVLFHAGNAQMWVYCLGFFGILLLSYCWQNNLSWRVLFGVGPALLIAMGIATPLLIPQFLATRGLNRDSLVEGSLSGLMSMIYPYPLTNSPMPNLLIDPDLPTGEFYYAGGLFTVIWIVGLASLLIAPGARRVARNNPLVGVSIVAFLSMLGHGGGLWTIQSLLPVFKQFAYPAKFLSFFHLFSLFTGAMLLQKIIRNQPRRREIEYGCVAVLSGLMLYHTSVARVAFYSFSDAPRYELPAELTRLIKQDGNLHRLYPAATDRGKSTGFTPSLRLSFPTMFGISSIEGYEPLWKERPQWRQITEDLGERPLETLRIHGVDQILLHRTARQEDVSVQRVMTEVLDEFPEVQAMEKAIAGWEPIYKDKDVELYRLPGAEPIARSTELPAQSLPVRLDGNEVRIDTTSLGKGGKVMVNYLWRVGIEARAGDRELEVEPDLNGRLVVSLPAGIEFFHVGYHIPWKTPLLAGFFLILAGMLWQLRPQLAEGRTLEPRQLEFGD